MAFNFKDKEKLDLKHPALLSKIRLITADDPAIFQQIKSEYDELDDTSSLSRRVACTLILSILLSERLYFAFSKRTIKDLVKRDLNLSGRTGFDNSGNAWKTVLFDLYNRYKLISLVQVGQHRSASCYRLEQPDVAQYLLSLGVDGKAQKKEALEFITKKFETVKPEKIEHKIVTK